MNWWTGLNLDVIMCISVRVRNNIRIKVKVKCIYINRGVHGLGLWGYGLGFHNVTE